MLLALLLACSAMAADPIYPVQEGKRICPICRDLKLGKSNVYPGNCSQTNVNCGLFYWDDNGDLQRNQKPCSTSCTFTCSRSHAWVEVTAP